MQSFIRCLTTALCLSTASFALSQAPDALKTRLDQVVSSYTKDNAYMGTVLVVEGDNVLLDKGYGMASIEWQIPNAPDVKFRLGSLTKQFTATLILLLQQDGKLSITDPVSKYISNTPPAWDKITIANLLGHTSGIPNFTNDKEFGKWASSPHTPAEELAFFINKPLDFEPGAKFSYSNSNFEVLGDIIEQVSGLPYSENLRRRLFDPLGMKNTGLDTDTLVLPKRAQGYIPGPSGPRVARSESMSVPWAAGSLYSTTGDLLIWEHALFGGKVLNEESLKLMTTPGKGDYGLGIGVTTHNGLKVVEHNGGIEGFNTFLLYVPERRIAIAVLSNINSAAPDQSGTKLLDVVLGNPVILSTERKTVPITAADLQKFNGVYDLSPTFSLTVAATGETLTATPTNQKPLPLLYQGVKEGHPTFYVAAIDSEIEFVPDHTGTITSLILHQNGAQPAKKRVP